jgi:transcriptional regulator with GAF, ATPase, and Fis domain
MASQETTSIAVCAVSPTELDETVRAVRAAGAWSIVPVQWPDAKALIAARQMARAYVLHSGSAEQSACADLIELLGTRPDGAPLIVIGNDSAQAADPNIWLPCLPPAGLLGPMLLHLIDGTVPNLDGIAAPTWRRKSDMIIGNSPATLQLLQALDRLAPAQTAVLVTGESGVGKELVARALHFCGPRAKHPFVPINCAAIPESLFEAELFGYQRGAFTGAVNPHAGAFEAADKGTLFLDEIGEMPLGMQAKLLRVLETSEIQRIGANETKKVNFRLVTATNRDLEREVKASRFREDLYYRVQVYPIHISPLRERPEDIAPIVAHHLSVIGKRENRPSLRLTPAAVEKILAYGWPGNVRELVNLLERAVLLAENSVIDAEHITLPTSTSNGKHGPDDSQTMLQPYRNAKQKFERDYYSQLMRTANGNVSLAAKLGKKTRKEVYDALKRLGLDAMVYRSRQ